MNRIRYIDVARGIGICLVVLGHNQVCRYESYLYSIIYSFHIPLFYCLSGYFHKSYGSAVEELFSRAKRYLFPFYLIGFCFIAIKVIFNTPMGWSSDLNAIVNGIIWGSGGRGSNERYLFWPPLWFLTSLFVTQVTFSIFIKSVFWEKHILLRVFTMVSMLFVFIAILEFGNKYYITVLGCRILVSEAGLPLNVDLLGISLFYYYIGYELRGIKLLDAVFDETHKHGNVSLCVAFVLCVVVYLFLVKIAAENYNGIMDLNLRNYGAVMINTFCALLGIIGVLVISYIVSSFKLLSRPLESIGRCSLVILIFHYVIQENVGNLLSEKRLWFVSYGLGVVGPIVISKCFISKDKLKRYFRLRRAI